MSLLRKASACGIDFAFRCCNQYIEKCFLQSFCRKDFFIMKTKLYTKKICTTAMLVAIAFLLGAASLRIGSGIKISFKFLPVFVCATLFGPFYGGLCGALADFLSYFLNPGGGSLIPQITAVEFLYGFSFGIFFHKCACLNKKNVLKAAICVLFNTLILSLGVMSFILKDLVGLTYTQTFIMRLWSSSLSMVVQFFGIIVLLRYMPTFKKFSKL